MEDPSLSDRSYDYLLRHYATPSSLRVLDRVECSIDLNNTVRQLYGSGNPVKRQRTAGRSPSECEMVHPGSKFGVQTSSAGISTVLQIITSEGNHARLPRIPIEISRLIGDVVISDYRQEHEAKFSRCVEQLREVTLDVRRVLDETYVRTERPYATWMGERRLSMEYGLYRSKYIQDHQHTKYVGWRVKEYTRSWTTPSNMHVDFAHEVKALCTYARILRLKGYIVTSE